MTTSHAASGGRAGCCRAPGWPCQAAAADSSAGGILLVG